MQSMFLTWNGESFWGNVSVAVEDDIKVTNTSGEVCFLSGWDISTSADVNLAAGSNSGTRKIYCFKPQLSQICTKLSVNFTSENCSAVIVKSRNITASGTSLFLSSLIFTQPLHFWLHPAQTSPRSLLMCGLSLCRRVFECNGNWIGNSA